MKIEAVLNEAAKLSEGKLSPEAEKYVAWVKSYVGAKPKFRNFEILAAEHFDTDYGLRGPRSLVGMAAAIRTRQNDIFVREGNESSALHELVHATGFDDATVGTFFSEGFTQLVTEEIADLHHVVVPRTYRDNVGYARRIVEDVLFLDVKAFARRYAKASKKAEWVADEMLKNGEVAFDNEEDWGPKSKIRGRIIQELMAYGGSFPLIDQLIDPKY